MIAERDSTQGAPKPNRSLMFEYLGILRAQPSFRGRFGLLSDVPESTRREIAERVVRNNEDRKARLAQDSPKVQ